MFSLSVVTMYAKTVLIILMLTQSALSANILALMTVASHSHHLWNSKYLEALANKGHRVTYLGIDEYKNPPKNITHILIENTYQTLYEAIDLTWISHINPYRSTVLLHQWDDLQAEFSIKTDALGQLNSLIRREKFDLVVYDIGSSSFLLGSVDVLGRPPILGITAFGVPTWALEILGNPMAYSSKPHFYLPYSDTMNLLQRANNYFLHLFSFGARWLSMRNQNECSRKCFGKDVRPLDQIMDDINIILVNLNYGLDYAFPTVPGLVPVGGLHIQEPEPLPQDLKTFLDEAKNGVVYFSLGTNLKSSLLRKDKVDILTKAFQELSPVQILWKWESDSFPEKPKNVKIAKWLPQKDVLAHPNVRLFFTHAGMLSTQEAIYHGKPIVGMPFFLDQHINMNKCVEKGIGERLDFYELTVEKIVTAIQKVLSEPRYAENTKRASAIFRDQMENPLDRAVYWTEYAIRHKGAAHLRYSARGLSWYQNWMLDVVILTLAFVFIVLYSAYKLINFASSKLCSNVKPKLKSN